MIKKRANNKIHLFSDPPKTTCQRKVVGHEPKRIGQALQIIKSFLVNQQILWQPAACSSASTTIKVLAHKEKNSANEMI